MLCLPIAVVEYLEICSSVQHIVNVLTTDKTNEVS